MKTIADNLAIEPNTKIWLSDAVHLELDGAITALVSYLNASSATPNNRLQRTVRCAARPEPER